MQGSEPQEIQLTGLKPVRSTSRYTITLPSNKVINAHIAARRITPSSRLRVKVNGLGKSVSTASCGIGLKNFLICSGTLPEDPKRSRLLFALTSDAGSDVWTLSPGVFTGEDKRYIATTLGVFATASLFMEPPTKK